MSKPITDLIKRNQQHIRFVLDCGAFTAHNNGKPIALDDYCRYLDKLEIKPWRYFALDVIGNPDATMRNYETMLARGFSPVPIFTRGESLDRLDKYFERSDLVGLGGVAHRKGMGYLHKVLTATKGKNVHVLGMTDLNLLKRYRPYMCDSSSLEAGARYARLVLYLGGGNITCLSKQKLFNKPPDAVVDAIRSYGCTVEQLLKSDNWKGSNSVNRRMGAYSAVRLSLDIQKNLGTLMFMACTTSQIIGMVLKGFLHERKRYE